MVNFNQFLKQAQNMQQKMQEMQERMANTQYVGNSGGGLVTVTLIGKGEVQKVFIDPSLLKETEKEMLEDLLVAAFNDARNKLEEESKNSMSNAFSGFNLPPGFKMPF